ncbi:MAG: TolC family protein [Bacteroidota bacterium]
MKTNKLITLTVCLLIALSIKAQKAVNSELVNLVNKSFTYNPRINELQQNVAIQEEKMDVAKTYLLPSVSATGSYNYIAPVGQITFPVAPGVDKLIQFQPNNNVTFGLGLNYQVLDFGRARANINKSKTEIQQSKDNVEFNKSQLAAQVATIYYGIVYLKSAVTVQDSILSSLAQTKKQTENKLKNGDALELDVLTINSNIDAEQNRKVELETMLEKQKNLLMYSTGINSVSQPGSDFNFAADNAVIVSNEELLKQAEQTNLDFKIAQEKTQLTIHDWDINKRNYYPSVNILGNAGMRNGYQPKINDLKFNYLVGVGFTAPIFQGGRYRQQKQLFEATNSLNNLTITTLKRNYERDIAQATADINSYTARLVNVQGQINQAQKALEQTNSRYKNGIAIQVEYINALTTLQRIKLSALNFEYQKCLAQVELTRLIGNKWW